MGLELLVGVGVVVYFPFVGFLSVLGQQFAAAQRGAHLSGSHRQHRLPRRRRSQAARLLETRRQTHTGPSCKRIFRRLHQVLLSFFFIKKIRPTLFNGCIDLFLRVCASSTGNSGAHWTVLSNGTLVVRDVRKEDAAALWCGAVNEAGSLVARTRLDVTSVSLPPPVVIEVGPANQTLPLKSPASLPCQAEGQPVRWLKGTVQFHHLFSPTQPF